MVKMIQGDIHKGVLKTFNIKKNDFTEEAVQYTQREAAVWRERPCYAWQCSTLQTAPVTGCSLLTKLLLLDTLPQMLEQFKCISIILYKIIHSHIQFE